MTSSPLPPRRLGGVPGHVVPLAALRRSRHVTQVRLAAALGVSQSEISRIERHDNVLLSTVYAYVLALGGELDLVVHFDGADDFVLDSARHRVPPPATGEPA